MESLLLKAPPIHEAYDTTVSAFHTYLEEVLDWFASQDDSYAQIDLVARTGPYAAQALGFRIALKIAESHRILGSIDEPVTVTLLNPVYKETGRMQTRENHPHGEDSIRYKMRALRRLEALNPNLTCRFLVIDDECPDASGRVAQAILTQEFPDAWENGKARVCFLAEAIDRLAPTLPPGLTHKDGPNRSVKGGAILLGMRQALNDDVPGRHVIIDNDADLSVHPEQIGLLIEAILDGRARAVAGSRREPDSASLIGGSRNARGQLFIQIWQHLLPQLASHITDTNRAFKAFSRPALQAVIDRIESYTFPYQIELLQACVSEHIPLEKRGIAYIDSEAASTQQGEAIMDTYLNQIRQIADIARRYQTIAPDDALLHYLLSISEQDWREIENNPPDDLMDLAGAYDPRSARPGN
jgi:hypothetical protein